MFSVGGISKFSHITSATEEVIFFNGATLSWHNMPSMKYGRFLPVLGVTEDHIIPYNCSYKFNGQRKSDQSTSSSNGIGRSFLLIVVGGYGTEDAIYSGEMYDSFTNKWTEIQKLPLNFGLALSGTVCGGMFYVLSKIQKLAAYDIEKGFWNIIQTSSPFPPNVRVDPYRLELVSSNGRLFFILKQKYNRLHEFDLKYHTLTEISVHILTEISVHPHADIVGESQVYVGDKLNLIFGVETLERSGKRFDHFSVCDVSESNNAYRINISTKYVSLQSYGEYIWNKHMAMVHVNI